MWPQLKRLCSMGRRLFAGIVIEERWLPMGLWYNLLITLGCVHSMAFGAFHMEAFLQQGLTAGKVAAVHVVFSVWNPLNDIAAGFLADEWVSRGFGSRLGLLAWAHAGWALSTLLTFQENTLVPVWLHYAVAICAADGFGSLAGALYQLVLVERTSEERQRIQIQRLNSVFGCGEWLVMAVAYGLWDPRPGRGVSFRFYLSAVCLGSLACTLLAVRGLRRADGCAVAAAAGEAASSAVCGKEQPGQRGGLRDFLVAAAGHANFRRYVVVCALLEAETVFFRQFDVVLARVLLFSWPAAARALLVVGDPLCGALAFLLTWVAERPDIGTYGVTWATLRVRLALCLAAAGLLAGHASVAAAAKAAAPPGEDFSPEVWLAVGLGGLMVLWRAATRPTVAFGGVIFASVIQEHALLELERHGPVAATEEDAALASARSSAEAVAGKYWMLRAAITKPLNSAGPVVGSWALSSAGYRGGGQEGAAPAAQALSARLWWTSASLPVALSLVVSLLVCPVWGRFALHGPRLEKVSALADPDKRRSA